MQYRYYLIYLFVFFFLLSFVLNDLPENYQLVILLFIVNFAKDLKT